MTLLSIVQDACNEIGLPAPSTVIGNTDKTVKQMLALSNRSGKMLAQRFEWQELITEEVHTTTAAEDQGAVETLMPGFNWYIYQTAWNRTQQEPMGGPLYPAEWQHLKATSVTGPYYDFRIRTKKLLMIPTPPADETVALEYISRYWCSDSTGVTNREKWSVDTDIGRLPEDLLTLDLKWRFKQAKGLPYAEEFRDAEMAINNAMARNNGPRKMNLDMAGVEADNYYGVRIPEGSWDL